MSYTNLTQVTLGSSIPPVDLTKEREEVLLGLNAHNEEYIRIYGAEEYTRFWNDTVAYYNAQTVGSSLAGSSAENSTPEQNPAPTVTDAPSPGYPSTGSTVFFDESKALMRKVPNAELGITEEREIRPPLRRTPDEIPMILRLVDRNMQPYGIAMSSGWAVTALKICPNPETIAINSAKIISRYQTMTRWVEDHWGDEIDVVNLSGSTFSFFGYGINGKIPGLTSTSRRLTQSYAFLKELTRLFAIDGFIFQDSRTYDGNLGSLRIEGYYSPVVSEFLSDPLNQRFVQNHPREGLVKERLYMNLLFDYMSCFGYLDSFDISEVSATPFRMTYTLVFKSEKTTWMQGSIAGGQ